MVRHEYTENGQRVMSVWNKQTNLVQIFRWLGNQWLLSEQYYAC
jgi:hypothetical protein